MLTYVCGDVQGAHKGHSCYGRAFQVIEHGEITAQLACAVVLRIWGY